MVHWLSELAICQGFPWRGADGSSGMVLILSFILLSASKSRLSTGFRLVKGLTEGVSALKWKSVLCVRANPSLIFMSPHSLRPFLGQAASCSWRSTTFLWCDETFYKSYVDASKNGLATKLQRAAGTRVEAEACDVRSDEVQPRSLRGTCVAYHSIKVTLSCQLSAKCPRWHQRRLLWHSVSWMYMQTFLEPSNVADFSWATFESQKQHFMWRSSTCLAPCMSHT